MGEGHELTITAPARNTAGYLRLRALVEVTTPQGEVHRRSDNLSSPPRAPIPQWLAAQPRVHPVPLPTGACWLNLQDGWWRRCRRAAVAGQSCAEAHEIDHATRVATQQLTARAHPWVWGRPPPTHRQLRRRFVYRL